MRKINIYVKGFGLATLLILLLSACNDFFEDPIEQNITQDTIFNSPINAEKLLNSAYYLIPYNWPTNFGAKEGGYRNDAKILTAITAGITDEAVTISPWAGPITFYYGQCKMTQYNIGVNGSKGDLKRNGRDYVEHIYEEPYLYFRRAFLFLSGVDNVKGASEEWKRETKAQAQLLVAIGYYELIKRYGSVPWVDRVLDLNESFDQTRLPLKDIIQNVDDLIMEALPNLPESYSDVNQGRVTRAAAYFLRSRLWLLAASPLFNTATPYIPTYEHPELITMGNYDESLWQKAATVSKEAIDYCHSKNYKLVDTGNPQDDYTLATRDIISNSEVILFSRRGGTKEAKGNSLYRRHMVPGPKTGSNKDAGMTSVTQNMVEKYDTKDGSPVNLNSDNPWENMDPRFHASVVHDRATFGGAKISTNSDNKKLVQGWSSGFFMRKFLHEEHYTDKTLKFDAAYFYMRLSELYLNYAEALNEYKPGDTEIANYLNQTRRRVDMPDIPLLGQEEMRQAIYDERAVELAFEDQRLFDVKRWKIADKTIGADKYGVVRVANGEYEIRKCPDILQRVWEDKLYLMPFPYYELNLELGLIQNPGYN